MLVKAKCVFAAWEYPFLYQPGKGPLPGGLYEIEHDGKLARMKDPRGKWVFEFDRKSATEQAASVPVDELPALTEDGKRVAPTDPKMIGDYPGKYTCKRCGIVFENLPQLGAHSRKCLVETAISEANEQTEASA